MTLLSLICTWASAFAHDKAGASQAHNTEQPQQYSIRNFKRLPDNNLAGGQPNEADLQLLAKQGIKTVINFRSADEFEEFSEAEAVAANDMVYIHIPIDSKDTLTRDNVAKFRAALDNSPDGAFLHCGSGNRVGALFALDAYWNQNKSPEEALAIGEQAGLTKLKEHIESVLFE